MRDSAYFAVCDSLALPASLIPEAVHIAVAEAFAGHATPSAIYRPALFIDGTKWCALYGENLQDGLAGFGDSPAQAMAAFDTAWNAKVSP